MFKMKTNVYLSMSDCKIWKAFVTVKTFKAYALNYIYRKLMTGSDSKWLKSL